MKRILRALSLGVLLALPLSGYSVEPLDLNTATAEQLAANLKGVGMSKAEAIVAYRTANGPFQRIEDLARVKGIGSATLSQNRANLVISNDQN